MASIEQETNGATHTSSEPSNMKVTINPQRASDLTSALTSILTRIASTSRSHSLPPPRLVAVSKLKPASDILSLHQPRSPSAPHFHFGENYVQELIQKSHLLPCSIRWHMIGGLQSNKCKELARDVPNLWAVESVDSVKKAGLLDKGRGECVRRIREKNGKEEVEERLRIFVQVNTSGEESKSGVSPENEGKEVLDLCKYVRDECPNLQLQGLMTIGAIARSQASTPETVNEDFVCLREVRDKVAEQLGTTKEELELSMGMSEDFEAAITQGSNEVRVGSTIFGTRLPKSEAKVLDDAESVKR